MNPVERQVGSRGCLATLVILPVLIFFCGLSTMVFINFHCVNESNRWIFDYPGAEIVSEEHNWLTRWGIGNTTRILYSPDSDGVVRAWYAAEARRVVDESNDMRGSYFIQIPHPVITQADDGEGTLIVLTCECAPALKMW